MGNPGLEDKIGLFPMITVQIPLHDVCHHRFSVLRLLTLQGTTLSPSSKLWQVYLRLHTGRRRCML